MTSRPRPDDELEREGPDLGAPADAPDEDDEDSPRDSALAAEDWGTTGAEVARGEPLSQRLRREVPETGVVHEDGRRPAHGRLFSDDGAGRWADDDLSGYSAEESAVHLEPGGRLPRREAYAARPAAADDRLDLLEAEMSVLLPLAQVITEAVDELARALERLPREQPDEGAATVGRAAHRAHQLLLSLRDVPR